MDNCDGERRWANWKDRRVSERRARNREKGEED